MLSQATTGTKKTKRENPDTVASTNGFYTIFKDGSLLLKPHSGQYRTWNSTARFVLMLAGTQGGKTTFGPWWLKREIDRNGEGDYLAVTTNFDLFSLKMLPEMRKVFEEIFRIGKYWPGKRIIEIRDPKTGRFRAKTADDPMYARIILRSVNAPTGLEASTAKAAWLDELGQEDWDITDWEAIQRRLSLAMGRVLATTTVYNSGWLKTEWYDRWKAGDKDYDVIQFASVINPQFPRKEFLRQKASTPEWRFKMFYEGEFAIPPGVIYHMFDSQKHVIPPMEFPPDAPRVVGVDFGGANTGSIWIAEDRRYNPTKWVVYHESLDGHKPTREYAEQFKMWQGQATNVRYVGGAPGEVQARMDFGTYGIPVEMPWISDVDIGISNVIDLMKTDRFRVTRNCKGLISELHTYHRKLDDTNTPTNEIDNKRKFHRLDGLRYAGTIIHLDGAEVTEM